MSLIHVHSPDCKVAKMLRITMHSPLLLFLMLSICVVFTKAYDFPDGQVQPGCYPPPALPEDFSTKPKHWRSAPFWTDSTSRLGPRQTSKSWSGWSSVKYLFTLLVLASNLLVSELICLLRSGDSYTSTKFDIRGEQPNPRNPLGNPPYPGSTSSNGPNYVDFLTTTYNQSYVQTYNLAFGGATVDMELIESPFGRIVQSFRQQVQDQFLPTYGNKAAVPWSSKDSLFVVFFGINDVVLSYAGQNSSLNYAVIKSYERLLHQVILLRNDLSLYGSDIDF